MTEIAIRNAKRSDIPAMAQIVAEWEATRDWIKAPFKADKIAEFLYAAFNDRIILVTGDPVHAYLAFDENTQRIGGLYSGVTGAGIGKALVDAIKASRDFICLYTHVPNIAAQKFYRREGFKEVSRHEAEPPNTIPEIRMEWRR